MSCVIREGTPVDIPYALALIKELAVFENSAGEVEVTVSEMTNWGFGAEKIFGFFVLEKKGIIIGIALYYYKYSTWKGKCLFLEDIIVTEKERRRGYGKLLFDEIVRLAKAKKVRRLEWQVLNWNAHAIAFYNKYKSSFDSEWINCKLTGEQIQSL
jgi:GNAT superfamily N-acetyltransferase